MKPITRPVSPAWSALAWSMWSPPASADGPMPSASRPAGGSSDRATWSSSTTLDIGPCPTGSGSSSRRAMWSVAGMSWSSVDEPPPRRPPPSSITWPSGCPSRSGPSASTTAPSSLAEFETACQARGIALFVPPLAQAAPGRGTSQPDPHRGVLRGHRRGAGAGGLPGGAAGLGEDLRHDPAGGTSDGCHTRTVGGESRSQPGGRIRE